MDGIMLTTLMIFLFCLLVRGGSADQRSSSRRLKERGIPSEISENSFVSRLSSSATKRSGDNTSSSGIHHEVRQNIRWEWPAGKTSQCEYFSDFLPSSATNIRMNFACAVDGRVQVGQIRNRTSSMGRVQGLSKPNNNQQQSHRLTNCNLFQLTVKLAPNQQAEFNLTYQELLQRSQGRYSHVITISPRQPIRDLRVEVKIRESHEIIGLSVTSHEILSKSSEKDNQTENQLVRIKMATLNVGHVSFTPSLSEQNAMSTGSHGINDQLIVTYDVKRQLDAGEVQIKDGYFIQYFAPVRIQPIEKNVVFLLDSSISMSGTKFDQLAEAMATILDRLNPGDLFNIISYAVSLRYFNVDGLVHASSRNIEKAKDFINSTEITTGTNTNDALLRGIDFLVKQEETDPMATRVSMLLFFTDGNPSTGITDYERILTNVRQANGARVSIYGVGLGPDVDFLFLQKLTLQNRGLLRQVDRARDISATILPFYAQLSSPLMKNVRVRYENIIEESSLSETDFPVYLDGSELVVGGRMKNRHSPFVVKVTGLSTQGFMSLDLKLKAARENREGGGNGRSFNFAQRAWAYLMIRKLQRKSIESTNETLRAISRSAAVEMSLQHSFLTPSTCLVFGDNNKATITSHICPDTINGNQPPKTGRNQKKEDENTNEYKSQGDSDHHRSFVDNDPHFLVSVEGIQDAVCFDIDGSPGIVYQLLHDKVTDITVNALITSKNPTNVSSGYPRHRTYLGRISVLHHHHRIVIDPWKIFINDVWHEWNDDATINVDAKLQVQISARNSVMVKIGDDADLRVLRHMVLPTHPYKVSFLGFYIADGSGLSEYSHGLIGQFLHQKASLILSSMKIQMNVNIKLKSKLTFSGPHTSHRTVYAALSHRRDMEIRKQVPCWHVANNAFGLIKGLPEHYRVPHLLYKKSSFYKLRQLII